MKPNPADQEQSSRLEWERPSGPAEGVGICLSGGGLRAAMFSLGVLQTLQERRGLLFGPNAARCLSAVSGGSYIASAYVANGVQLAAGGSEPEIAAPFSLGSPEEEHLLSRGNYLASPLHKQLWRVGLGVASGPIALAAMLIWVGFFVALVAYIVLEFTRGMGLTSWAEDWPWWLTTPSAVGALVFLSRSRFADTTRRQLAWAVPGLLGLPLFLPPAIESLFAFEALRTVRGWGTPLFSALGAVVLCAGAASIGRVTGFYGSALNVAEALAVRVLILMLIGAAALAFLPAVHALWTDTYSRADVTWFVVALLGPLVVARILRVTSLHHFYRENLYSAFGAIRTNSQCAVVPKIPQLLSRTRDPSGRTPQLLISATANVRHQTTAGRDRTFTSFVFSDRQCGVPTSDLWFDTAKLEFIRTDGYMSKNTEPLVTLPTSVAATGAAISASMGRYTRPSGRLFLALLNIRLGRTLPNAAWPGRRSQVSRLSSAGQLPTKVGFALGLDDLLAELLGTSGPNMYISDGGHYDNLGLMSVLRARCKTVWCVDASPDQWGAADELRRVAALAADELGVSIEYDRDAFVTTRRGLFPVTHLRGTINYGQGVTGDLHVIKLGLQERTRPELLAYGQRDRAFPHHSTLWQIYPRHRMEAYRDLGRDNTARCLQDVS